MNYLAIDTSRSSLTVAVGGKKSAVEFLPDCALNHSVVLMEEIEKCLNAAGLDKTDIDVFACSVGAGSFTGIRIGVATVKALAYALGKKVLAVTSFETLAYNVADERKKLAVIDARHDNYYVCGFDENMEVCLAPSFMTISELESAADGFEVVSDCESLGVPHIVADVKDGFIEAVEAKLCESTSDIETLVPLYVKKSQAEEEA